MLSKFDIIVSVGEPQTNTFGIMGIVHKYCPQQSVKLFLGKDIQKHDEIIDEMIKHLVTAAKESGANAIYNLRIEMLPSPGAMATCVMFNVYGTAVKLN